MLMELSAAICSSTGPGVCVCVLKGMYVATSGLCVDVD